MSSTATQAASRHQESPRQPLAYLVRSGGDNGRVFQPTTAKYTIGSLPNCNVPVAGEGVRPVHCMVIHGPCQTIVRRWAPDSHLNGVTYDDASLEVGDRLQVGEIELEIIAGDQTVGGLDHALVREAPVRADEAPERADESDGERSLQTEESTLNRDVERRLRRRSRRLLAALRHERSLRTDTEQNLDTANDDYHILIKRLAALDATRSSERSEWRKQISTLEAESKRLQRLCTTLQEERDEAHERLTATGQTAQHVEQNKREIEFAARAKCHELEWQLEEVRAALDTQRESFERQRADWNQQEEARQRQRNETETQFHDTLAERNQQIEQLTSNAAALADEIESVRLERDSAREEARAAFVIPALKEELRQLNDEYSKSQIKWDEERRAWQETHQKDEEDATERNQSFRVAEHFLREDLAKKEAEISDLQSRLAEIEADVQTAQSAQADADALTEELTQRDAKLQELTEKLANCEKQFDAERQSWEETHATESQRFLAEQQTSTEEAEKLRRELAEQVEAAKELTENLDEIRRYASSLQDRLSVLDEDVAQSKQEVQSRDTEISNLNSQIEVLREALHAAHDAQEESRAAVESTAADLAERDARLRELTDQLTVHEQQLADDRKASEEEWSASAEQNQAELQAASQREELLRAELSVQVGKADELAGELDEVRRYTSSLQDRLTLLEESSSTSKQEVESRDSELADLHSQIKTLREALAAAADEPSQAAAAELAERDARLRELTDQLAAHEQELAASRAAWDEERRALSEQGHAERQAASETEASLKAELSGQLEKADELAAEHDEIRRYASSLQDRLTHLEEDTTESKQAVQSRDTELSDLNNQIETLREALSKALDAEEQSRRSADATAAELAERDTQLRELADQLAVHEQQIASDRQAWEEERQALSERHAERQIASETEESLRSELSQESHGTVHAVAGDLAEQDAQIDESTEPQAFQVSENADDPDVFRDDQPETAEEVVSAGVFETPEEDEDALGDSETLEHDASFTETNPEDTEAAIEHLRALNIWQQDEGGDASGAVESPSYIERFSAMFEDERDDDGTPVEGGCRNSDHGSDAGDSMSEPATVEATGAPVEVKADEEVVSGTEFGSASVFADDAEIDDDEEDDDESLQSYLARLAERVRGERTSSPSRPSQQAAGAQQTQSVSVSASETHGESSEDEPKALLRLEDIKRNVVIPERSGDFDAMRRLANATARDAIGAHDSRAKRNRMLNKVLAATVGLLCGVWVISAAPAWLSLQTVLGVGATMVGVYWTGQTLALLLGAIRRGALDETDGVVKRALPPSPRDRSTTGDKPDEDRDESLNWIEEPASKT